MEGLELLKKETWQPLSQFGLKHKFFNMNYSIIVNTWVVLLVMLVILIPVYIILKRKPGLVHFMITSFIKYFVNLTKQSLGFFEFKHFAFVASIFMFILMCNLISIIPGLEEPTQDVNTTLALGVVSFLYTHYYSIKTHGLWAYIKEYFEPFFPMFPLNVVGKIASIVSISFRLFGNIFGGVIISKIYFSMIQGSWWKETMGILSGINFVIKLFFGLFEGGLQAFVFTMLTVTYLSIELQKEEPSEQAEKQQPDQPNKQNDAKTNIQVKTKEETA
ncbi:F0F1 ATP synthase subunit A [Candidatus Dependentiae bacterium]